MRQCRTLKGQLPPVLQPRHNNNTQIVAVEEAAPPAVEEAAPAVEEAVLAVEEAAPAVEEAAPAVEKAAPTIRVRRRGQQYKQH